MPAQPTVCRWWPPIRFIFFIHLARLVSRKGIVRDNGGHTVALAWSMKNIYDVAPGEVFWRLPMWAGWWGMGYIVYAPLLAGCTTLLYEGKPVGTPDAGAFWRVIAQHKVKAMFTAPTAFRAIKRRSRREADCRHDLTNFKTLFLAESVAIPDTLMWAQAKLKVPVIDHWWQTETGWAIAANCRGIEALTIKPGSPTKAAPGWDVRVLNDQGKLAETGKIGALVVALPMPPGAMTTLWQAEDRFHQAYFKDYPGYYKTGDAGYLDQDGYVFVMSRTDDIINVAGHRLSTGAIEEILASHPAVAECAVVGAADSLKGQLPVGFVVLKSGQNISAIELKKLVLAWFAIVSVLWRAQDGFDRGAIAKDPFRKDFTGNDAMRLLTVSPISRQQLLMIRRSLTRLP